MRLKIVVGGGVLDAPDWYESYRTFAIYCAVGRPALWPPESWNIAYRLCAGNHPSVRCADSAQTAPGPLCRFATSPRPAGSHPQGKPTPIFGLIPKSQRHLSQSPGTVTAPAGAFRRPTGILIPALRPEIDRSLRTILSWATKIKNSHTPIVAQQRCPIYTLSFPKSTRFPIQKPAVPHKTALPGLA